MPFASKHFLACEAEWSLQKSKLLDIIIYPSWFCSACFKIKYFKLLFQIVLYQIFVWSSAVVLRPIWGISGFCQVISPSNSSQCFNSSLLPQTTIVAYCVPTLLSARVSECPQSQYTSTILSGRRGRWAAYCTKSHLQTPQVIIPSRNRLVNSANLPKTIHSQLLGDLLIA